MIIEPTCAAPLAELAGGPECPKCGEERPIASLLTSMMRYYRCPSCAARWSTARNWLSQSE